ncbi:MULTISPECIES: cell wall anchor protein [unclassified Ensifer]|uniref:cell wall anchor protein n=1 Tax=unclassified Ensifer TaxID=2633371 RepID=UPI0008139EA2|nr:MULTISPECIES: cell wall anchor protein [unclassified Ensifer]OCP04988.1 cell wall anchor protein [Ensifer sp. LC14]OCP11853.1 cell wall anchor protein [Ensifer sp. LC13]OCP12410.1 cell wall anchor protein [Ensifer sp. LC11]OCP33623.1 cell wall anchor protein [Ensifer sp. LC499]
MRFLLLAAAAFVLSACTSTTSIDTAIQKNLPQVCSAAATAHSAFVIVASTGNVKPKTVAKEAAAWAALEIVCKDPGSVTAATALVKAAEAYAAITLAMREAKAVE